MPAKLLLLFMITGFSTQSLHAQTTVPDETLKADTSVNSDGMIFEKVEIEASFSGGEQGWIDYLQKNLNAATPVINGAPAGRYTVTIQFIVDKNGKLSALKALTKHGFGMEAEVMRILRKSPPWNPALQDGRTVKAYRLQPVTFVVVEEKKKKRGRP
jgi:periplasmic protein TonB